MGCHARLGSTTGTKRAKAYVVRSGDGNHKGVRVGEGGGDEAATSSSVVLSTNRSGATPYIIYQPPSVGIAGCYKNEQTAFACYYHTRGRLTTLGCHEFYDHGLFAHGIGSMHHERCKRTRLDYIGFSTPTCDAIARHVDTHCRWREVGRHVTLIHFKGKGKPWKHLPTMCTAVRRGPFRTVSRLARARAGRFQLVSAHDSLYWDERAGAEGACRSVSDGSTVAFATSGRVPRICCETHFLQKAEWFGMATIAGLWLWVHRP